jgi:hypothetical protein
VRYVDAFVFTVVYEYGWVWIRYLLRQESYEDLLVRISKRKEKIAIKQLAVFSRECVLLATVLISENRSRVEREVNTFSIRCQATSP